MRGFNGDFRPSTTNALDTINAAASVIASSDNSVPQASVQKRRWGSCFSVYWCFGYYRHRKRIGHAVLVPESSLSRNDTSVPENLTQSQLTITLPFVAPPSSPASFLQSEPPSASQSPAGIFSLTSISASMYSPSGPASIFAIGPYAHETQLVSPPVFSTFTTEPSTAPFTPPAESVHLTTPSSPEVPFAQLLDPSLRNGGTSLQFPLSNYEFQSYQLYPGSPMGQLISPSSGVSGSGTSSPFPDGEFAANVPRFPEFQIADPRKFFNLDNLSTRDWGSRPSSGTVTPDAARLTPRSFPLDSDLASHKQSDDGNKNDQVARHRVLFELTAEYPSGCAKSNPAPPIAATPMGTATAEGEANSNETSNETPDKARTNEKAPHHQKHRSITLGSLKEFNFDNTEGGDSQKPNNNGLDWSANGSDTGKDDGTYKNWSFPVMQPSVS